MPTENITGFVYVQVLFITVSKTTQGLTFFFFKRANAIVFFSLHCFKKYTTVRQNIWQSYILCSLPYEPIRQSNLWDTNTEIITMAVNNFFCKIQKTKLYMR